MNNNEDDIFETKDTTSHLYRIVPDIRNLIVNALMIVARLPTSSSDKSKIDQAINALGYPLPASGVTEPSAPVSLNLQPHSDPMKEATWQNTLAVIRRTVQHEISSTNDSNVKEQLKRILNVIPNVI